MIILRVILSLMWLIDGWWWWTADRRLRSLRHAALWRSLVAAWVLFQIGLLSFRFLPASQSRPLLQAVPLPLVATQYLWHLGILPIAVLIPFAVRGARAVGRLGTRPATSETVAEITTISRRRVIASAAAAVAFPPALVTAGSIASVRQFGHYRVRRMTLKVPTLPAALDGLTIAHLSDFHAGRFVTPGMIRNVVDTTNDLRPDLVLLTGDLIDYALSDLSPALDELQRLRPTHGLRHGVSMCIGNHDLIDHGPTFIKQVREAGFSLINNAVRTIEVRDTLVQLAAIGWYRADDITRDAVRFTERGLDRTASGGFPILLAHHPHAFDAAAGLNLPLTLSGHTHGGQLMATKDIGAGSIMFRYWSGLYQKPNGSQLVVSNGIGNWYPLRINAPAEIVHLTLTSG